MLFSINSNTERILIKLIQKALNYSIFLSLLLTSLLLSNKSRAQNRYLDSLRGGLKNSGNDTLIVFVYKEIGNYYQNNNFDSAKHYYSKAISRAKQIKSPEKEILEADVLVQYGWSAYIQGEHEVAKKLYTLVLKNIENINAETNKNLSDKKNKVLAINYNNFGLLYNEEGNYGKALEFFFRALKLNELVGSKKRQAVILENIGLVYFNQDLYDKAIKYSSESLEINSQLKNSDGVGRNFLNLGNAYFKISEYEKSLDYFNKALETLKDPYNRSGCFINIAYIYATKGNYAEALKYNLKALELFENIENKKGIAVTLASIGDNYLMQKKYTQAEAYLKKAETLFKEQNLTYYLKHTYQRLYEINEAQNNFKEAVRYFKEFITYRDSLNNQENQKASIEKEMQYNFDKEKALKEAEHKKQLAVEQEAKQRQKVISWAIGIGLMLVAVFLLIVFNRLQITRKQKNIIEEQKLVVEEQKQVVEEQKKLVEEKNKEIIDSITYAKRIQNAILPSPQKWKQALPDSFVLYLPKDIVAGDFYFMEQSGNYTFVAAADCTGHGVPGAMVSVVCSNALTRAILEEKITQTNLILNRVREIVIEKLTGQDAIRDGMDICLIRIEKGNNTIQYSGANRPLWYVENNTLIETKGDKQPIGKYEEAKPFTLHNIPLSNNSTLYLSTDGYADQFGGERGKKISVKTLKEKLLQVANKNIQEQYNELLGFYTNWKGTIEQIDDVTVVGITQKLK